MSTQTLLYSLIDELNLSRKGLRLRADNCGIIPDYDSKGRRVVSEEDIFLMKNYVRKPPGKSQDERIACQKRVDDYIASVGYMPSWLELYENVDNNYKSKESMAVRIKRRK